MSLLDQLPHNSPDLFTNNVFGQRRYKTESSLYTEGGEVSTTNPLSVRIIDSRTGRESEIDVLTRTTLTSSDTFTYTASKAPILILDNVTGGALTVTIDGSTALTALTVAGVGSLNLSTGLLPLK